MIEPMMKTPPADVSTAVTDAYVKAYNLNVRIVTSAQAAQMSLYDVCRGLKEMHDTKLYKELGYNSFDNYCEQEIGISRFMGYKYIKISQNVESIQHFGDIGVTKLSLLCDLSEEQRTEIARNTDLEATSVRELKEEIARMKDAKEKSDAAYENSLKERDARYNELEKKYDKSLDDAIELEGRIKELEARPVEVAVQGTDSREVENMRKAMAKLSAEHEVEMAKIQDENFKQIRRLNDEHNAAVAALNAKVEELRNSSSPDDLTEVFKAFLVNAVDASKRLLGFVAEHPEELYKSKTKELFNKIITEV